MKTVAITRRILAPAACRAKHNVCKLKSGISTMYAIALLWYSPQTRKRAVVQSRCNGKRPPAVTRFFNSSKAAFTAASESSDIYEDSFIQSGQRRDSQFHAA